MRTPAADDGHPG